MVYVNYILKYLRSISVMSCTLKQINYKIAINHTGLRCGGKYQEQKPKTKQTNKHTKQQS